MPTSFAQERLFRVILVLGVIPLLAGCAMTGLDDPGPPVKPRFSPPPSDSAPVNPIGDAVVAPPDAPPSQPPADDPPALRLGQAVLMALENNRQLRLQRVNPLISRTFEDVERAAFDPVLSLDWTGQKVRARRESAGTGVVADSSSRHVTVDAGARKFFSTGTQIGIEAVTSRDVTSGGQDEYATRAGLTVTQALLRGFGREVNLASLRQAQLDVRISEYELRGFAQSLVAAVEIGYWEAVLAERRVAIFEESLRLAERQLQDIEKRIRVGNLAETELAAAQAEIALRREDLIDARSARTLAQLRLCRLIAPERLASGRRDVVFLTDPAVPDFTPDPLEDHVALAHRERPEMNQARLLIRRRDLELVKTRNGLLPRMDLFAALGRSGYADSFGNSISNMDDRNYDVLVGASLEYPAWNRAADARHRRAAWTRRQAEEALANLADLVHVDVETALTEVYRFREQVAATAATRRLQEEKLRAETAKFNVGASTSLLVAATQRDLVASQVAEIQAVIRYLQAIVSLHLQDGSLLELRGIEAPGWTPAEDAARF